MILGRRPDMGARALRLVRTGIALFTGCATATSCVPPPPVPAVTLRAGYVACLNASDLQLFLDMPVGEVGRWDGQPWNVRIDVGGIGERRPRAQEALRVGTCVLTQRLDGRLDSDVACPPDRPLPNGGCRRLHVTVKPWFPLVPAAYYNWYTFGDALQRRKNG